MLGFLLSLIWEKEKLRRDAPLICLPSCQTLNATQFYRRKAFRSFMPESLVFYECSCVSDSMCVFLFVCVRERERERGSEVNKRKCFRETEWSWMLRCNVSDKNTFENHKSIWYFCEAWSEDDLCRCWWKLLRIRTLSLISLPNFTTFCHMVLSAAIDTNGKGIITKVINTMVACTAFLLGPQSLNL